MCKVPGTACKPLNMVLDSVNVITLVDKALYMVHYT